MSEEDNWKWQKELLIKRDKEHQKEIEMLNYIIDKQDRDIVALSNGNRKLKEKIDKATEYVKNNVIQIKLNEVGTVTTVSEKFDKDEFLDILQGSDKEC